jgi:transcriptional regulator with XRE-family HTH domain
VAHRTSPLNICGPRVKKLRAEQGLTQEDLAARCQLHGLDISRDTIANIEARRRWVGDMELRVLARALSVPIDTLVPPMPRRTRA